MSATSQGAVPARGGQIEATGLGRARLAWLQATHRRGPAAALCVCLLGAIALPALLPLVAAMAVETELSNRLTRDGGLTVRQSTTDVDALNALQRDVDGRVTARLGAALVPLGAYATVGPLALATVAGGPPTASAGQRQLTAVYADHLASHVEMVAGELPPDGLGGGETAVAMPQSGADLLGLHLSDRVCFDWTAGPDRQPRWCARIVGLWQPTDVHDPYWTGASLGLALTMGRYDFFGLVKLHPPQAPTATLRFWANSGLIDPGQAGTAANQVHALIGEVATPQRQVSTRLDRSLGAFAEQQRLVSSQVQPFSAAVALLGLFVVGVVAARFLNGQAAGLALLRARGWSGRRVWRVAFSGLIALTSWAGLGALAVCALVAVGLTASGWLSVLPLRQDDIGRVAASVVASVLGLIAVLVALSVESVRRGIEPSLDEPFQRTHAWWQRRDVALMFPLVAVPALLGPRLVGPQDPPWGAGLAVATALGMVLLAATGTYLCRLVAQGPRGGGIAGQLARWQLQRDRDQHAGAAFVLLLASAIGSYAGIALASELADSQVSSQPTVLLGLATIFLAGTVSALVLSLVGFGLHFAEATRHRLVDYGGLFAHGLSPSQVTRSLASEQAAVATPSVLVGAVLGIGVAVASQPLPPLILMFYGSAAIGLAVVLVAFMAGVAIVAPLARRLPSNINPMPARSRW